MPASLSRIIHHSHSFTRREVYHHIHFINKSYLALLYCGTANKAVQGQEMMNSFSLDKVYPVSFY